MIKLILAFKGAMLVGQTWQISSGLEESSVSEQKQCGKENAGKPLNMITLWPIISDHANRIKTITNLFFSHFAGKNNASISSNLSTELRRESICCPSRRQSRSIAATTRESSHRTISSCLSRVSNKYRWRHLYFIIFKLQKGPWNLLIIAVKYHSQY